MEQKVMELLAKIYQTQTEMRSEFQGLKSEFQDLRSEFQGLRSEFQGLKNEFQGLKSEFQELRTDQEIIAQNVVKIITVVEHDVAQKIGVIFDFREIQIDQNQKTGQALERIEGKVEVLQLETSNLRRIK